MEQLDRDLQEVHVGTNADLSLSSAKDLPEIPNLPGSPSAAPEAYDNSNRAHDETPASDTGLSSDQGSNASYILTSGSTSEDAEQSAKTSASNGDVHGSSYTSVVSFVDEDTLGKRMSEATITARPQSEGVPDDASSAAGNANVGGASNTIRAVNAGNASMPTANAHHKAVSNMPTRPTNMPTITKNGPSERSPEASDLLSGPQSGSSVAPNTGYQDYGADSNLSSRRATSNPFFVSPGHHTLPDVSPHTHGEFLKGTDTHRTDTHPTDTYLSDTHGTHTQQGPSILGLYTSDNPETAAAAARRPLTPRLSVNTNVNAENDRVESTPTQQLLTRIGAHTSSLKRSIGRFRSRDSGLWKRNGSSSGSPLLGTSVQLPAVIFGKSVPNVTGQAFGRPLTSARLMSVDALAKGRGDAPGPAALLKKRSKSSLGPRGGSMDNGNLGNDVDTDDPVLGADARAWLPAIAYRSMQYIEKNCLEEEGVYRVPGSSSQVAALRAIFDAGLDCDLTGLAIDPMAVSSMFKAWLREIPQCVLGDFTLAMDALVTRRDDAAAPATAPLQPPNQSPHAHPSLAVSPTLSMSKQLSSPSALFDATPDALQEIKQLLDALPLENWYLLRGLSAHLSRLAAHAETNRMPLSNLRLIFSPSLGISPGILHLFVARYDIFFRDKPFKEARAKQHQQYPKHPTMGLGIGTGTGTGTGTGVAESPDLGSPMLRESPSSTSLRRPLHHMSSYSSLRQAGQRPASVLSRVLPGTGGGGGTNGGSFLGFRKSVLPGQGILESFPEKARGLRSRTPSLRKPVAKLSSQARAWAPGLAGTDEGSERPSAPAGRTPAAAPTSAPTSASEDKDGNEELDLHSALRIGSEPPSIPTPVDHPTSPGLGLLDGAQRFDAIE